MNMKIITDEELGMRTRIAFVAGVFLAAIAIILLHYWFYGWKWTQAPIGAPEIVLQTASRTVARIPTQHDGNRVDCTVIIDQARNIWSITC